MTAKMNDNNPKRIVLTIIERLKVQNVESSINCEFLACLASSRQFSNRPEEFGICRYEGYLVERYFDNQVRRADYVENLHELFPDLDPEHPTYLVGLLSVRAALRLPLLAR